jgi:hypothetical protein
MAEKQLEAGSPNKIGLPEGLFKSFLKKWKKQNLNKNKKDVKQNG